MIRYSLKCGAGHGFESWFQNAAAYAALAAGGQLTCPVCGAASIEKDLMTPSLRPAARGDDRDAAAVPGPGPAPSAAATAREAAIAAMRKHLAETSDYVGPDFAAEARRIHEGRAPERAIHGEARADEARQMIEDGLPVAPLPFRPLRKVN